MTHSRGRNLVVIVPRVLQKLSRMYTVLDSPANASLGIHQHHNRKVLQQALQETGTNPRERKGNAQQTSQALLER